MQTKQLRVLFEKINELSRTEHEEIFKIIKEKIPFSKNKNGIFFNLSNLEDDVIVSIDNFVKYCISNKQNLDDYDKKLNECKINNNYNNIMGNSEVCDTSIEANTIEDWNHIISESKSAQKISLFIEKIMNDRDKIGKKKLNIKFNNAKKRYAKRPAQNLIVEIPSELEVENYIII